MIPWRMVKLLKFNTESVKKSFVGNEVEELFHQISTNCPFTQTKITLPVRSIDCNHLQCFDISKFNFFFLNF
jgi:hypothetical protein